MGCPSQVVIGDNLVFSICTHDPDTGILTDADSLPVYRVYEDETATAILTGTLAKLDDANTTGFYTELIACTTGNGFENGKTYTVYIEATVDSDTGGIAYGFKALDSSAERNAIADALLKRDWTAVSGEASRSVLNALRFIRNRFSTTTHPGQVTIFKENDTDEAWTATLSTDASAVPIIGSDPT